MKGTKNKLRFVTKLLMEDKAAAFDAAAILAMLASHGK